MENAKNLIQLIKDENQARNRVAASQKDEIAVMRAMINDKDFKVQVYDRNGATDQFISPSDNARSIGSKILTRTTKMPRAESNTLMSEDEFTNKDAEAFVNISKEFISGYMDTGRKLPLGKREKSDISLSRKIVEPSTKGTPIKVDVDANGNDVWETKTTYRPGHESIRVHAPHPPYIK